MNTNTNTQTDTEMTHMSLQIAHFFPHFFKMGKYLLPLLVGLFILAACGGGGAAPTTVEPTPTTGICETNLFDDDCKAPDVETKRAEKIVECFTGDAVGTATCKDAREANTCLEDPFDEACTADTVDADFAVHLEPAKMARAEFCRQGNNVNNAELCGNAVTSLCTDDPFDTICGANVAARQTFCRTKLSDDRCTTTISTFCATITADNFANALCSTSASAALRGTYCVGLQAGDRPGACGDDATEGSLIRAYCEGGSAEALLDTANNCATSLANACLTAPFGHACTTDANIRAQAVMCRNNTNGSNSCDATRTVICEGGGAAITANIFDDLCDVGYDNPRTMACVNAPAPSVRALPSPKCGSEIAAGYLFAYCQTPDGATNNIHCPVRYAASGVRAERWQTGARDATNEKPLNLIPAGGASKDDALSNFIVGGEDGLGFVVDDTITEILRQDAVKLDILDDSDDGKSGFGYARVRLAGITSPTFQVKSYVGLLSGTDVGAPIRDNTKTGVWNARLTFLLDSTVFSSPSTFILDVSFGPNTIKTRAGSLPIVRSDGTRTLAIDGKFTDAGVLYGTTDFYVGVGSTTSEGRGTLSGVIGADGAVGVFASDVGARNTYAGGFVAALGCTDNPFNVGCTSDADFDARLGKCRGDIMTNGAGGCDAVARVICVDGQTGANPITANILDPLCSRIPEYVDNIITMCNGAPDNRGVFAVCPERISYLCPNSGTRNQLCPELAVTDGKVDFVRWAKTATDATNTNKLTILPAITGQSDRDYSYVEGRRDGLERGDDYLTEEEKSNDLVIDKRNFGQFDFHQTLRLSELAGSEDTSSGVAFRRFSVQKSGRSVATKRYVGVLSDTDLGAPISASTDLGAPSIDNPMVAIWDARLEFIVIGALLKDDFTMEVNFNAKTIKASTIKTSTTDPAFPEGGFFSRTFGNFIIDGKFTNTGVIYGTTSLKRNGFDATVGSLTGLIGERGAVGVFFSNDRNATNSGTYVGGFVAVPMFCASYPFANGCDTDEQIMTQLELCRGDINTNGVGGCDATFDIICRDGSTDAIVGNPFDSFCLGNAAYDDDRVSMCLGDETRIGDFAGCDSLLENLCPLSGARNSECPVQVATGADFIRWKQEAVDTDGTPALTITDSLTILEEVGGNDANENYVQAGADELNRGFLVDENGQLKSGVTRTASGNTLNLSDVGLLDDTASGMKAERYRYTGFTTGNSQKFYAGIFSGTDLGAPLTVDNPAEMIWNAKLVMVDENGFTYSDDFTLEVNFGDKSIRTRVSDPVQIAFGTTTGTIILSGKFTPAGVIYGTSQVKLTDSLHASKPNEELTSDGSITGLIGEKGAVGAFISDGDLDGAGRYAGGFVARNNSLCRGDTLFDIDCYKSLRIIRARADMCEGNMDVNGVGGCVETAMDICSDTNNSGSAINPFHMICDTGDDTYDESRRLSCVNNRDGYSGSSCADLTTRICITENKPLNTICADGTNTYDVPRQAACVADSIEESLEVAGCEPVITALCRNANAFSGAAGAGDVKFNCYGSDLYHGARQDACLGGSLPSDVCTATIDKTCDVDKEYFSGLCEDTNDDDFEIYEQARLDTCAANADDIQSRGATAEDDVIAQCFNFLDVDCSFEPFKEKCYVVNLYESKRLDKCSSDIETLEFAGATPADCNRPELAGVICAVTGENANPFAPICAVPTAVAVDFDLVAVQQGFCRDGANINGADCADTVTNFCDVASGADLFDDLCDTGNRAGDYLNYRVAACGATDERTGVYNACTDILDTHCTNGNSPACAPVDGTLSAAVWVYTAPNADNTGRLEILAEAQQDDADTNYVQGNATGLNLGFAEQAGDETVLSITHLDNVDDGDAAGSVAFVRITFTDSTPNKVKYYAGLLNNVDLGAPLANNSADGIWNARFSAIVNGAVQTDIDTSIVINFADNSLRTNDDDLVTLSGVDSGSITINANFTAAGVIYGTSSWTVGDKSSVGSVTGLIGAKGAIGAFVSSGENTDGEYVGGFVAAPVAVECVGAVAFTNPLCDGAVGKAGRIAYAETCRTTECTEFVDRSISTVTFSVCTHRMGGDPHQAGCESDGFDAERIARNEMCIMDAASYDPAVCGAAVDSCFTSGTDNNCGQLAGAYCDANMDLRCDNASLLAAIVCRDLPLDSRCDTGYDEERQTACGGEDVTTPRMECADVISTLCLANPLDNAAGAGETKFDCAGSVTYKTNREMACAGQDIATPSDSRCLPVFADFCSDNPFNDMAGVGTVKFNCAGSDDYHTARRDVCYDDIITNGGTNPACTATIAQACEDDIFDGLCFDRADGKYSDYETDRVSYCQRRVFSTSGFTLPTVEGSTVCSAFIAAKCDTEPFEARCTIADDDAYASQRLGLCGGTITDLTAAYATPADCNTDDLAGVICDTGNVLAINPFAPICSDPTAIAIIDNFDLVTVQQGFCRDGANINGADCANTIANFCDVASGANLFDDLCNTGDTAVNYTDYRVAACQIDDADTLVNSECGNILDTHCTNGNSPACEPAEGTLPTSVWVYNAPNADNTGRLEILEDVQLADADTNYVQGNATGLNLGELLEAGGVRKTGADGDETVLSISDLDNVDDAAVGSVAFVRIEFADFTTANKIKYYAGLLDNVDLGGPVPETTANAIWNASFSVITSGGLRTNSESTMIVNFNPNTINTRDDDDPVMLIGNLGSIEIDADFTAAGVIFGTSTWVFGENSLTGSVTGLIGKYGAIGAFVGSGKNNFSDTLGEYAGGFVAAPVDCSENGTPFHRLCGANEMKQEAFCDADAARVFDSRCAPYVTEEQQNMFCDSKGANAFDPNCAPHTTLEQKTAFAKRCRLNPRAVGCDRVIVAETALTPAVTVNDCTNSDIGNPYQTGCTDDGFNAEQMARTLGCKANGVYNTGQCSAVLDNCFSSVTDTGCESLIKRACDANGDNLCVGEVPKICGAGGTDPLSIICETGYDAVRNNACALQDIATLTKEDRCFPVITAICNSDPFNNAVMGLGGNTFDCTAGDTYLGARQTVCAGEDIAMLTADDRCKSVIDTVCESDPFNRRAGVGAVKINCAGADTYDEERRTACLDNINADGDSCVTVFTTPATNTCLANPAQLVCDEVRREARCKNNTLAQPCLSIIVERCRKDPLNPEAGAVGGARTDKFNCATLGLVINSGVNNDERIEFANLRAERVTFCKERANSEDPLCLVPYTKHFIATCAKNPFDVTKNPTNLLDVDCTDHGNQYEAERASRVADCRADVNRSGCDNTTVRDALCVAGEFPFAPFCDANNFVQRVSYCTNIINQDLDEDPRCVSFAAEYCANVVDSNLFNPICTDGDRADDYAHRRVAACRANMGVSGTCGTVIATNCTNAQNPGPECDIVTTTACAVENPGPGCDSLTVDVWENYAVNSNSTARLTVLDEIGADDPDANYVKAGADGLNLEFLKTLTSANPTERSFPKDTIINEAVLKLYDAGTFEDTAKTSGVAFAGITSRRFTDNGVNGNQRFYAGILSGTDLGGPVTNTTDTEAEWSGGLGIVFGNDYRSSDTINRHESEPGDFKLRINFVSKSFTADQELGAIYGRDKDYILNGEGALYNARVHLAGSFNDAGVIYGTSTIIGASYRIRQNEQNSCLTKDARAENPACVTYSRYKRDFNEVTNRFEDKFKFNEQTKQFVLDNEGNHIFDSAGRRVLLDENTAVYQVNAIGGGSEVTIARGTLTGLIGQRGAVGAFVSNSDEDHLVGHYAGGFVVDNPDVSPDCSVAEGTLFDLVLCRGSVAERVDHCIEHDATAIVPSGFDADSHCKTAELLHLVCESDPLNSVCTDDDYDYTRQLTCSSDLSGFSTAQQERAELRCETVVEKLCTTEPFNRNAGAGGNKFDCASDNSNDVVNARNKRITLCLATPDDPLCKQGDVSAALATCADNPLDRICTEDGVRAALTVCSDNPADPICTQSDVSVALAACADNPHGLICTQGVSAIVSACAGNTQSPLCLPRGVPVVLATCAADPFDAVCTDFATQYSEARNTRLMICSRGKNARGDTNCDNARATICVQGGAPFAQICEGYDTTPAMMIAQTCATDTDPTNSLCDKIVSGAVTVKECIADPYKARCSGAVFYSARAAICESEATSFTAGCLTDSDFASNYRPADDAREAREALITRCADTSMSRTNCDTDIGNSTTLLQCIENPFLTDCLAEAVASALREHRDAFVARCADTSMDNTGCEGAVGSSTIASCIMAFDENSCAMSGAFDAYRVVDCTMPANVFALRCQGGIDEAVITARAELALNCAVTAGGTGCNTIIVSGSLTVNMCNTNPFLAGCEDVAFANARFEMCKTAEPKHANCGVAEGQGVTNYVLGGASELDLGENSGAYKADESSTPDRDESTELKEGVIQGGLTLNNLVEATDNDKHGFAFAYIPTGPGGDNTADRYYAGLLSGTDVGAEITAEPADANWHGKVFIVSGLNGSILTEQADFILNINFANKTLTSGDIAVPRLGGFFAIDGKFAGKVIYGATSLRDGLRNGISSIGSVTGLIGADAAVGAFVSSGTGVLVNTFGEYAGGFVASSAAPAPAPVDCSDPANLHPACANNPDDVNLCAAYDLADLQNPALDVGTADEMKTRNAIKAKCVPVLERLAARELGCADPAVLNNEGHECATVITEVCSLSHNLFKTAAGTGDTKFDCLSVTRYDDRRKQICRSPAYRSTISACGDIIVDICTNDDPFTQTVKSTLTPATNLCDSSYNDARKVACARLVSRDTIAPQKCFNTIVQVCNADPFDENFCYATHFDYTATRLLLCYADMGVNGQCGSIIQTNCPDTGVRNAECRSMRFTEWAVDVNTDDSDAVVASIPEDETKTARILLGRANGLDKTTNVASTLAPEFVLRLGLSRSDADYTSGFAVFSATTTNGTIGHYAGILSGTDVGLPITYAGGTADVQPDATWLADIAWVSDNGRFVKRAYKFALNVDFAKGTISGSGITDSLGHVPNYANTDSLKFSAFWTANGILIGTTTLRIPNPVTQSQRASYGILTGMIGNDGAVGVFASEPRIGNDGQPVANPFAYAGGFVAKPKTNRPPVVEIPTTPITPTVTAWATATRPRAAGAFTNTGTARYASYFITGLADGLGLNEGGRYAALNHSLSDSDPKNDVPEFVLRLDDIEDSAGYTSGAAFFFGSIGGRNNERYFTGLLSGTTVGANLPYRARYLGQASAIWGGVISARFGHHSGTELGVPARGESQPGITIDKKFYATDRSFQIEVNFQASTIKTPAGVLTGAFYAVDLRLDGQFDRNGIMSGIVTTTEKTDLSVVKHLSSRRTHGPGTFNGIIGQDAAIGVFKADRGSSQADFFGYVGGFYATPCTLDVSTPTCKNSPTALTAFCANRSANAGKNSFHSECDGLANIDNLRTIACLAGVTDTQSESRCPGLLATACLDTTNDGGKKPFQPGCSLAPDQTAVADAQRDACLGFATFPDTSCQTLESVKMACEADPFTQTGCETRNDYDAIEGVFCATAAGIATAACPNATSGDWVASITDLNTDPATATDSTPTNEFLQIAEQTISTEGTTKEADGAGGDPDVTTLNFSDISYDGASFSADDGLAYFSGYQDSTLYHYAGIFGSTDLGAPIDESGFSAIWIGLVSIKAITDPVYFALTVAFDGADGTVDGFIANVSETSDLLIKGTFVANGVITGDVHYAVFTDEATPETPPTFNGSLSGLIGTDGLVAAFISTATGTDGYAGGFIATPPVGICKTDIFDAACPARVRTIPAITAFCTNITDNLGANPFNTGCIETTHGEVANAQRDACLDFATFPDDACKTLGPVRTACETDFFAHVGCNGYDNSAEIESTFCQTNAGIATAACPNATSGDWVAIITDLNTDLAITTPIRDVAPVTNEFLQIAGNTISTTGTTEAVTGGDEPEVKTLDFSDISHDGASLSADDGLVYFGGYKGGELYYYAAIYGTSDLGAPIADTAFSATWPAMLSILNTRQLSTHGKFRVQEFRQQEFELKVTFDGTIGTLEVDNQRKFISLTDTPNLRIYGEFDKKGVITGEVDYGHDVTNKAETEQRNGTLSGLISAEGLVAVFFANADEDFNNNNKTSNNNYKTAVGGFVAAPDPQVIFADWTSSFDGGFNDAETLLASGVDATGFAANTASFITLNRANQIAVSNNLGNQPLTDPTILRLDSAASDGQKGYESGVAFWHGDAGNAGSETSQYYAGLLVGTDLGAPLTDTAKNGTWTGTIAGITNGDVLENTEVRFKVIFGDTFANGVGTIKSIANGTDYVYVNDDTLGAVNVNAPNTGGVAFNNTFDFTGGFNAQGVIMGTVAHTNGEQTGTVNGVFNGLIGANGTVGVFKSNNGEGQPFGFIGGFVATPPAE